MAASGRVSPLASSRSPSRSVFEGEGEGGIAEDTLFVAVSREVDESKSVLLWAVQNRGASVLHVHQPDKFIPTAMGKLPVNLLNKPQIDAHRVKAGKIYVEVDLIQDGIVKLITEKKIDKIVMGAAADTRYSKDMIEILSEKAKHVKQHAPGYCHIWFVSKKLLIHTSLSEEMAPVLMWKKGQRPDLYSQFWQHQTSNQPRKGDDQTSYSVWNTLGETEDDDADASSSNPLDDGQPIDSTAIEVVQCLIQHHNTTFTDANVTTWSRVYWLRSVLAIGAFLA